MPSRLKDMFIKELSFVDNPAEPNSRIHLFKRDDSEDPEIDEMWVEELIEVGKAQPTSTDVSTSKPIGAIGGPRIKLRRRKKTDEDGEDVYKANSLGAVLEAEIHRHFTNLADGMYANGNLTREERIGLSSAIGEGLQSFIATAEDRAPEVWERGPADTVERGNYEKATREFSSESRERMAERGVALPDGSFPIPDRDALRRAIQSIGRAATEKRAQVIAHIRRRAAALGATEMIPDTFKKMGGWEEGQDEIMQGPEPAGVTKEQEGKMGLESIDLTVLPDDVREAVETEIADLTKRAEDAEAEVTVLKAVEPEPDPDELLKSADPLIREMVEKAQAEAAEATTIAKAEREARLNREFMAKAESLPFVPGETKDTADFLKSASESLSPEQYEWIEKTLSTANSLISKGDALKTYGSGRVEEDSAEGRVQTMAKARAEEKGISRQEAYAEILEENPDLYAEMDEEVSV